MIEEFKRILSCISRFMDRVIVWSGYCGAFLVLFGMVGINLDVCSRYFFNRPIGLAYDISRWTLLYATLLMGAWVLREDGHVKIDIFLVLLKEKPKALVEIATSILIVVSCLVFFYQGTKSVGEDFISGMMTNDTTVIKRFWLTLSIPVGSFLLIWQSVRLFRLNVSKFAALMRTRDQYKTESNDAATRRAS